MIEEKNIYNITLEAKMGNIESRNKLIENNQQIIEKYAKIAFEEIKLEYLKYYNLDDSQELPNNIIDLDDIKQELYLKTIDYFNLYAKNNLNVYFSSFINNYISKNLSSYIKKKLKKILNIYDNEIIEQVDIDYINYINLKEKEELKKQILDSIKIDPKLKMYEQLIKNILDGLCIHELTDLYKTNYKKIYKRIKNFLKLYKKQELKNKALMESLNEEYIFNKLIKGELFEVPIYNYYLNQGTEYVYQTIGIDNNISKDEIKEKIYQTLMKHINKYLNKNIYDFKKFNELLLDKLYRYVYSYKQYTPKQFKKTEINIKNDIE